MRFNKLTYNISIAVIAIFAVFTLIYSGITGVLLCSSIALLTAAFVDSFEIIVAITVLFGLFYHYFLKKFLRRFEPFQNKNDSKQIIQTIQKIQNKKIIKSPEGVHEAFIEGFEDLQPTMPKEGSSSNSTPASSNRNEEVKVPSELESTVTETNDKEKNKEKEDFESATGSLFKPGKLPSENAAGGFLDSGSTLLKSMEAFNPEQMKAMTTDSKKLLETQKNLMEMLQSMQPVLKDGKQLLDTFSGMFGGGGAGGMFKL